MLASDRVRVQMPVSRSRLDFRAHHFQHHEHGLAEAILILDDRPKPSVVTG